MTTPDGVRGDIANALQILEASALGNAVTRFESATGTMLREDIGAAMRRLRSALAKLDAATRSDTNEQSTVGADADGSKA